MKVPRLPSDCFGTGRELFRTTQRSQRRVNSGGRHFSTRGGFVQDVTAQLFDDLADIIAVEAAQPGARPGEIGFNLLLRIARHGHLLSLPEWSEQLAHTR